MAGLGPAIHVFAACIKKRGGWPAFADHDGGRAGHGPIEAFVLRQALTAAGVAISQGSRAQSDKSPAYVAAEVQVTDPPAFQAYAAKVPAGLPR